MPFFIDDLAGTFHDFLTLLLLTQSRVTNIPLFLIFELQLQLLRPLLLCQPTSVTTAREGTQGAERAEGTEGADGGELATASHADIATLSILFQHVAFFALGGSNSIASVDLSNAYNGVSGYNVVVVGVLTFIGNWAGPVWWASATHLLLLQKLRADCASSASSAVVTEDADQDSAVASAAQPRRGREQPTSALTKTRWVGEEWNEGQHGKEKEKGDGKEGDEKRSAEEGPGTHRSTTVTTATLIVSAITHQVALHSAFTCVSLVFVMAACTALRAHLFIWSVFSPKYLYAIAWSVGQHLLVNVVCGALFPLLYLLLLPRLHRWFHSSASPSVK